MKPINKTQLISIAAQEKLNINSTYEFEFELEQRRLGEQFDRQWRKLWLEWRQLNAAYLNSANVNQHDHLSRELGLVRQEMVAIEQKLDGSENDDFEP